MSINQCLILAAGHGTRMGKIGKHLPKPMWPLFEYTLLEVQIIYAKQLGITNIFINTHYLADQIIIKKELMTGLSIEFIAEKKLMGSGGGIQNILRQRGVKKAEPMLILNSDAFYLIDEKSLNESAARLEREKLVAITLFPVKCFKGDQYNKLLIANNELKGISKAENNDNLETTYSGVSLCLPERVEPFSGESSFFETIADYKNKTVLVESDKLWEYWDFGTFNHYFSGVYKIINLLMSYEKSVFVDFLLENKIINPSFFESGKKNYRSRSEGVINFSKGENIANIASPCIIIKDPVETVPREQLTGIVYGHLFEACDSDLSR